MTDAPPAVDVSEADERLDLLALCTESKRLERARKEAGRVPLQIDGEIFLLMAATGCRGVCVWRGCPSHDS